MSAVGGFLLLCYAIFDVIPDPERNLYWRVTCGVFAPFIAYTVFSYAKDAVRLRRRARRQAAGGGRDEPVTG